MKDEEINLEEIEVSHTLGGTGRSHNTVIHTIEKIPWLLGKMFESRFLHSSGGEEG